jgi:hypothetical protein
MRQNVTVSLEHQTVRKARILAAKKGSSISRLLAEQIESLVQEDEDFESAKRQALALLEQGFHMGNFVPVKREELHER